MKRLASAACVFVIVMGVNSALLADLYTPSDSYLMDEDNWVDTGAADGTLYERTDLAGPGVRYEISLDTVTYGDYWSDIQIGDGFDLPSNNSGLATGFDPMGSGFGTAGYDTFGLTIRNPNADLFFMANLFVNSGWTDDGHTNETAEATWTWLNPGEAKTFYVDLTQFTYPDEISMISLKIGANIFGEDVASGAWNENMGPDIHFNVDVVPVPLPAAVLLGMLGLGAAGLKLRKYV